MDFFIILVNHQYFSLFFIIIIIISVAIHSLSLPTSIGIMKILKHAVDSTVQKFCGI